MQAKYLQKCRRLVINYFGTKPLRYRYNLFESFLKLLIHANVALVSKVIPVNNS